MSNKKYLVYALAVVCIVLIVTLLFLMVSGACDKEESLSLTDMMNSVFAGIAAIGALLAVNIYEDKANTDKNAADSKAVDEGIKNIDFTDNKITEAIISILKKKGQLSTVDIMKELINGTKSEDNDEAAKYKRAVYELSELSNKRGFYDTTDLDIYRIKENPGHGFYGYRNQVLGKLLAEHYSQGLINKTDGAKPKWSYKDDKK